MPPHDVVDSSLIVDQPRKQKMTSYVTNEDNVSVDRMETIKRILGKSGPPLRAAGPRLF